MQFSFILLILLFQIICINFISCKQSSEKKSDNDDLTDYLIWARYNNLSMHPSLKFTKKIKNMKTLYNLYTKETIPENTTLIHIPSNIILNITKILDLINLPELKKQYEEFMDNDIYEDDYSPELKKDEAFLTYIFYQIHDGKKKILKSKFYKKYKHYINSFQINSEYEPLFFDDVGVNKLYLSYINTLYSMNKRNFEQETYIFKGYSYYKRDIDYDEYLPIRIAVINNGLTISEQKYLIPVLNMINTDYIKYNSNFTLESDGSIRIYSTREIQAQEEIIFFSKEMSNARRLLFEGRTYPELNYYFDEYLIPAFGISLYVKFNLDDPDLEFTNYINLLEDGYEEDAINIYKDHLDILKRDDPVEDKSGKGWPFEILLNNLKAFKEYIISFGKDKIYEYFDDKDVRINVERVILGDKKILEKAYEETELKAGEYIDLNSRKTDDSEDNPEL
jgi:hypothetical protein